MAEASNVLSFERSGHFRGRYHVLGGFISPLRGVGRISCASASC